MQTLSVTEEGIAYLGLAVMTYSKGCAYFAMYVAALLFVMLKGSETEKRIFLPPAFMMLITVFNPLFPILLSHIFDVNNEYYRFFWIAPVVILVSYVFAKLTGGIFAEKKYTFGAAVLVLAIVLAAGSGQFLYKDGYIKAENLFKMPTEIPEICRMIHEDSEGRYDGDYYPRAVCELDYEMCLRQYDSSIMLITDREAYLNAVAGNVSMEDALGEDNYYDRVLLPVLSDDCAMPSSKFLEGLEKTGTEYVCVSGVREDMCSYLEDECGLRLVGKTANHSLYHYDLKETEGWRLPDYTEVWENY